MLVQLHIEVHRPFLDINRRGQLLLLVVNLPHLNVHIRDGLMLHTKVRFLKLPYACQGIKRLAIVLLL
jgi:hypothetical protein